MKMHKKKEQYMVSTVHNTTSVIICSTRHLLSHCAMLDNYCKEHDIFCGVFKFLNNIELCGKGMVMRSR